MLTLTNIKAYAALKNKQVFEVSLSGKLIEVGFKTSENVYIWFDVCQSDNDILVSYKEHYSVATGKSSRRFTQYLNLSIKMQECNNLYTVTNVETVFNNPIKEIKEVALTLEVIPMTEESEEVETSEEVSNEIDIIDTLEYYHDTVITLTEELNKELKELNDTFSKDRLSLRYMRKKNELKKELANLIINSNINNFDLITSKTKFRDKKELANYITEEPDAIIYIYRSLVRR